MTEVRRILLRLDSEGETRSRLLLSLERRSLRGPKNASNRVVTQSQGFLIRLRVNHDAIASGSRIEESSIHPSLGILGHIEPLDQFLFVAILFDSSDDHSIGIVDRTNVILGLAGILSLFHCLLCLASIGNDHVIHDRRFDLVQCRRRQNLRLVQLCQDGGRHLGKLASGQPFPVSCQECRRGIRRLGRGLMQESLWTHVPLLVVTHVL